MSSSLSLAMSQELLAVLAIVMVVLIVINSTRGLRRSVCSKCGRFWAMKQDFRPGVAPPKPGCIEIACKHCGHREWTFPESTAG